MVRRHWIATLLLLSAGCATQVAGALTDADGYPLVGNVVAKGSPRPRPRPPAPPPPRQAEFETGEAAEKSA